MGSHDYANHRGALAFMGGHKGYGLGYAAELLAGILSGFGTIGAGDAAREGLQNRMFALVLDPARFADPGWMAREAAALRAWALASPPADPDAPVLAPGDPERAARQRGAVPVPASVIAAFDALAEELGVAPLERG
jgi:uncharacterized oxidoreductase